MPKPRTVVLMTREMQDRVFSERHLARLGELVALTPARDDEITPGGQLSAMTDAEIILTGWGTHALSDAMFDAAPGLKVMCHSAGSVKHLLPPGFAARGIRVTSAAPALAVGVAEFAFGLMLMSMKAVWACIAATNAGRWEREPVMDWICEPHGATVGIIAASSVGRELLRLCKTLSLKSILLYDPFVSEEEAARLSTVFFQSRQGSAAATTGTMPGLAGLDLGGAGGQPATGQDKQLAFLNAAADRR